MLRHPHCRLSVEFVGDVTDVVGDGDDGDRLILGEEGDGDWEFSAPSALALVPGLGLVVRELGKLGTGRVASRCCDFTTW